jgi:hypothetical protein
MILCTVESKCTRYIFASDKSAFWRSMVYFMFMYGLFTMLQVALTIQQQIPGWLINLKWIWKHLERICIGVNYILSYNLPKGLRKATQNLHLDSWCPGRDLHRASPKYKLRVLPPNNLLSLWSHWVASLYTVAYQTYPKAAVIFSRIVGTK